MQPRAIPSCNSITYLTSPPSAQIFPIKAKNLDFFVFHEMACMKKETSQKEENNGYPYKCRLSVEKYDYKA
jgi:hypothetical protein